MNNVSRTRRSARNALVAAGSQIVLIGLSFATRTVFITQLGTEILGVHTLLLSITAILAVADLGINTAIMHALYGPLQKGDDGRVSRIVRYAAQLYRRVALVVGVIGASALPLIPVLVNLDKDVPYLQVYFLILLVDSAVMYLMVHRSLLVTADQRMYLVKTYTMLFAIAKSLVQIVTLLLWQDFLIFLIIQVLSTLATNGFLYWKAGRWYPFLHESGRLPKEERKLIAASVRAMMVYRLGGVAVHNTDPVLISMLVGTVTLGYFSNYLLVVGSIVMLAEVAFSSLTPSVGNLLAARTKTAAREVFEEIALLAKTLYGVGAVALFLGLDVLMSIWLGEDFVLGPYISAAVALNFYIVGTMAPVWAFRGATGMFRETQYVFLVTAILNLGLSVILGHLMGLIGILIATGAARLLTGNWYEPWVLLSRHLGGSTRAYLLQQLYAFVLWTALGLSGLLLVHRLDGAMAAVIVAAYVACLPLVAVAVYGRTAAYQGLSSRVRRLLRLREA